MNPVADRLLRSLGYQPMPGEPVTYSPLLVDLNNFSAPACSTTLKRNLAYFITLFRATPRWANYEKMQAVYDEAEQRRKNGERVSVDHVHPLKAKDGSRGLHWEGNLKIITIADNNYKGNRSWPNMPNEQIALEFEVQHELLEKGE